MNTGMPSLSNRPSGVTSTADNLPTSKASSSNSTQAPVSQQSPTPTSTTSAQNSTNVPNPVEAQEKTTPSLQEVIQISDRLNESIQSIQRDISFSVDDSLGEVIIKVIDRETQETIRQIPSEEMLNLSRNIEEVRSLLFDKIEA